MKTTCMKLGINGEGICYKEHIPVFVKGLLPTETAEIKITEDHGTWMRGEVVKLLEKSTHRIEPCCPIFDKCGGCALLSMDYEEQLVHKRKLLTEALWKYGHIGYKVVRSMHKSAKTTGWRSACKLPISAGKDGKLVTGMYQIGTNHFITVRACAMHDPMLEQLRISILDILNKAHLSAYDKGHGIRYLILRSIHGEAQCALITGKDEIPQTVIDSIIALPGMRSLVQSINTQRKTVEFFGSPCRLLAGEPVMTASLFDGRMQLQLSAESFFQLNIEQAQALYQMAVNKIDRCNTVVEAYCGCGAMSILAKDKAEKIIGLENVAAAIENAKINARLNGADNCEFRCADAANGLRQVLSERTVDALLLDPPRSGMDERMIETLLLSNIKRIIYVSCNPATLARNLKDLKQEYDIMTIIPYDLFPNTPHVESITVLTRRGKPKEKKEKK